MWCVVLVMPLPEVPGLVPVAGCAIVVFSVMGVGAGLAGAACVGVDRAKAGAAMSSAVTPASDRDRACDRLGQARRSMTLIQPSRLAAGRSRASAGWAATVAR